MHFKRESFNQSKGQTKTQIQAQIKDKSKFLSSECKNQLKKEGIMNVTHLNRIIKPTSRATNYKWLQICILIIVISVLPKTAAGQGQQQQKNQNNIQVNKELKDLKQQEKINFIPAQIVTSSIDRQKIDNQVAAEQIIEVQREAQMTQEKQDQLQPWIQQEMQQMNMEVDLPITQTFQFVINEGEQLIYKWNPSKNKQLKIVVNVFSIGRYGDLEVMRSSEENYFVEILTKNPNKAIFNYMGKVYSSKVMTVDFDTDYKYLKFINKNIQKALISIDIQKLEYVVQKGVEDLLLSSSNNKMNMMLEKSKSSQIKEQHMYKWQWGFLQNEQLHQMKMLGFSGIQLFTIIVTALVQMFSIKNLLDNRAVV